MCSSRILFALITRQGSTQHLTQHSIIKIQFVYIYPLSRKLQSNTATNDSRTKSKYPARFPIFSTSRTSFVNLKTAKKTPSIDPGGQSLNAIAIVRQQLWQQLKDQWWTPDTGQTTVANRSNNTVYSFQSPHPTYPVDVTEDNCPRSQNSQTNSSRESTPQRPEDMAAVRKKQDDKYLEALRELITTGGGNRQCFDCGQKGPTYVNMTIGSFVCTRCSGVL